MGPQLKTSTEAGINALRMKANPTNIGLADFFEPVAEAKRLFTKILGNSSAQDIAIIPSVSYGMATVAKAVTGRPGDRVVTVADVFPSGLYAWQGWAQACGGIVNMVKPGIASADHGEEWNTRLLEEIARGCRVVFLPQVHWSDGTVFDLVAVREVCDQVGALLVLDLTQSLGALPVNFDEIRPDAVVCAGYKWLLGPYALGYLYISTPLQQGAPLEENWINRAGSEDFRNLTNYTQAYKTGAAKYSMGEQSNMINLALAIPALEQLITWRATEISAYSERLLSNYWSTFQQLGLSVNSERYRSAHLFGLALPERFRNEKAIQELGGVFQKNNIAISFRGSNIRVCTHVTTREADVEAFLDVLKETM